MSTKLMILVLALTLLTLGAMHLAITYLKPTIHEHEMSESTFMQTCLPTGRDEIECEHLFNMRGEK